MNKQEKEEFADYFKSEWKENRENLDILCANLRAIRGHGSGYVIEKLSFQPNQQIKRAYTVTVNFFDSVTYEHERITFYANYPLTVGIEAYQVLT